MKTPLTGRNRPLNREERLVRSVLRHAPDHLTTGDIYVSGGSRPLGKVYLPSSEYSCSAIQFAGCVRTDAQLTFATSLCFSHFAQDELGASLTLIRSWCGDYASRYEARLVWLAFLRALVEDGTIQWDAVALNFKLA